MPKITYVDKPVFGLDIGRSSIKMMQVAPIKGRSTVIGYGNTFFKPEKHIKIELSGGYFQLPNVKNFALNKYGLPTYSQINLGLTYQFDHYLKGLNALLLVVRKDDIGETYQNDRYIFNKVNMTHFNLIFN